MSYLTLKKRAPMPDANALDDLGFDNFDDMLDGFDNAFGDDNDDGEDREATLKAGATIKAMLPPPRRKENGGTIRGAPPKLSSSSRPLPRTPPQDDDMELDLFLPLNLTNLKLVSQSQPYANAKARRPRVSVASTSTTDWDSPCTSTSAGKMSGGTFSWGEDSPTSQRTRLSETSVSDDLDHPGHASTKGKKASRYSKGSTESHGDDDDMEAGLVLPDPAFFSTRRAPTLNSILDRKRKQHYAPHASFHEQQPVSVDNRTHAHGRGRGDDSFEDGLVFDNPSAELSQHRLNQNRRARTTPVTLVPIQNLKPKTVANQSNFGSIGKGKISLDKTATRADLEKRKKIASISSSKRTGPRKPAMLIKHLGGVDKKKVVGDMTWNPQTQRWEGNEACLRDFDVASSSVRPALITHYTGMSIGGSGRVGGGPGVNTISPANAAAAVGTIRIVGDMKFDPEKMCWVSILPPDEDEPDPFEDMADDEDEDGLGGGIATITRSSGRKLVSIGLSSGANTAASSGWSSRFVSESMTSIAGSVSATSTASWEERGPPESTSGSEISPELWAECREAEERHRKEMKGWTLRPVRSSVDVRERERREEKRLWEVRNLALRS